MLILRGKGVAATLDAGVPAHGATLHLSWPADQAFIYVQNNTGGVLCVKVGGSAADPAAANSHTFKLASGQDKPITIRNRLISIYCDDEGAIGTVYTYGTTFVVMGWPESAPIR